jgi:hypothetical protein
MSEWQPIETAPDDFDKPGGQRVLVLRDAYGQEFKGKRGYFNNSGWGEAGTNREIWPTQWRQCVVCGGRGECVMPGEEPHSSNLESCPHCETTETA